MAHFIKLSLDIVSLIYYPNSKRFEWGEVSIQIEVLQEFATVDKSRTS